MFGAEFWVAVGFFIFLGILVYYKVPKIFGVALDRRARRIRDQLHEATHLREEAETLLKEFEAKRHSAEQEAADIISRAKADAERLSRESEEKLADFITRRTAAAEAKIAQAEAQAAAEVRAAAADAAVKAAEKILQGELSAADSANAFMSKTLKDVRAKLQ